MADVQPQQNNDVPETEPVRASSPAPSSPPPQDDFMLASPLVQSVDKSYNDTSREPEKQPPPPKYASPSKKDLVEKWKSEKAVSQQLEQTAELNHKKSQGLAKCEQMLQQERDTWLSEKSKMTAVEEAEMIDNKWESAFELLVTSSVPESVSMDDLGRCDDGDGVSHGVVDVFVGGNVEHCIFTQMVIIALNLLKVPYILDAKLGTTPETAPLSVRAESVLCGTVTTLQHQDNTSIGVSQIVEYLTKTFPASSSWSCIEPVDPRERIITARIVKYIESELLPAFFGVLTCKSGVQSQPFKDAVTRYHHALETIEQGIKFSGSDGPYFFSNRVSQIDIMLAPMFRMSRLLSAWSLPSTLIGTRKYSNDLLRTRLIKVCSNKMLMLIN